MKFKNERYKVPLPWKEFHAPLPDNYKLSVDRLHGLLRQLKQDPAIFKEYEVIIQDQLGRGIDEVVPADEVTPKSIHYLSHHAVVRKDKATTKVCIVHNASAQVTNGHSLNGCLLKGPKFNHL